MFKRVSVYSLIFVLILSLSFSSLIFASSEDQRELEGIIDRIDDVKNLLTQGKKEEKSLSQQIEDIDKKIDAIEKDIAKLQKEIKNTQEKINEAQRNIEITQTEINGKNDILNARLRAMYKNGEVGVMEVLLGSADFQEFMTNLDMVKRVTQQDVNLLKELEAKYDEMNLQKRNLEQLKYNLYQQKENIQQKQKNLEVNRGEAAKLRSQVEKNNKALESQIDELNKYAAEISERIRKAQSNEAYVGGVFTWPAPGYSQITSTFGYRIHPILKTKKLHTGIDIGVPSNSTVVAANDGTVIHSNWLGGYGKAVMVDHGGGIVTLYAHNNDLLVNVGDKVKKGQVISKSGSTGMSTGPHLHFEVRLDGNYVDPMPYLK